MTATVPPAPAAVPPLPPGVVTFPPTPGPPRRGNRLLGAIGILFAIASVAWGCGTLVDLLGHTSSTVRRTMPAVTSVRLDLGGTGPVRIIAEERSDTLVVRRVSQGLRETKVRETVEGTTLVLYSRCPQVLSTICNASYEVHVPLGTSVTGRNDGASIRLDGVTGVDVRSADGRIQLDRVSGKITARADGASIRGEGIRARDVTARAFGGRVDLRFAVAPDHITAHAAGARVIVEVPAGAPAYAVDAVSHGGSEDVSVVDDPHSSRTIDAEAWGASVEVRAAP